jgi:PAS domain S-box-containing protein
MRQKQLKKKAYWFESILDSLPMAIGIMDTDMNFTFINKATEFTTGKRRKDMVGKHCSAWNAVVCRTERCGIERLKKSGDSLLVTEYSQDGRYYRMETAALHDSNGKIIGYIEVDHDETALEAANSAKSRFLSHMSHEIRTPMNAIIGMTSIAKLADDAVKKDDCIKKVDKASKHLLGIVNQILDISKIESEKFSLDSYTFHFEKMIDEVTSILGFSVKEKQLELEVDLDNAIPRFIVSDKIRFAQILQNLLTNAVKFTPEGGKVTLTAKLLVGVEENALRIEVADTVVGIPKEHQSYLFDDFVQLETDAARRLVGTGLGLPISKKIVEMMGGNIWADSEPGEGSRFIFIVPLQAGDESDAFSGVEIGDIKPDLYKGNTILVAEDMEINREIVIAFLESVGIKVECAIDGAQAVQMFSDAPERYDLIFMDLQMPNIDGITATRMIRELGTSISKRIPIVAMTANVFREDIETCIKAGMNDHLSKPLEQGQIMAKLGLYLRC